MRAYDKFPKINLVGVTVLAMIEYWIALFYFSDYVKESKWLEMEQIDETNL